MYEQQFNPFAANVAIIKGYFKSGKVLAVGILYIVSAILDILTILTMPASVYSEVLDSLSKLGISATDVYLDYASLSVSSVITTFVFAIFTVLTAVGFIIIFTKSRSASPDSTPIAGVTILHVLATIAFVFSIVFTVLFAVAYLIVVIAVTAFSYSFYYIAAEIAAVAMIIVGILLAIVMFLLIFTTVNRKTYYRSVKYSLTTVKLQNKGAGAWGVISIIMAVGRGISLIDALTDTLTTYITAYSILTLLSLIVTFVIHILNASIALGYTKYINLQKSGYNNTPYGGTPNNTYAPAPNNQPVYRAQPTYQNPVPPQSAPAQNPPQTAYYDNFTQNNAPAQEQRLSVCPKCGTPVDSSLPFCGNCGNKL